MKTKISIIFIVLLMLTSCELKERSDIELAYDVLSASWLTYDTTFSLLGPLADVGVVSEAVWDKAAKVGREYKKYHNLAVGAFDRWRKDRDNQDKADFFRYYDQAMDFMRDLQKIKSTSTPRIRRGM